MSTRYTIVAVCMILLTLVVACAAQPTPTPLPAPTPVPPTATLAPTRTPVPPTATPILEPTAAPTEAVTEWHYVALGDSLTICCGSRSYPEYYADHIMVDLGVKVNLTNFGVSGMTSDELLRELRSERWSVFISQADIVTVNIGANDFYIGKCSRQGGECGEEALDTFISNYAAIVEEILTLRSTDDTILRIEDYPNPFVNEMQERGVFDEWKSVFERQSEQLRQIAAQYDIPFAQLYLDFNGPDGDQDPSDKGYIYKDGIHFSDEGARRAAQLLRELGYEPLVP